MTSALTKALLERERILARIGQQRAAIETSFAGLAGPVHLLDRAVGIGRYLRSHPLAVAVLAALIVVLRTRSVLGLVTRGLGIWRLARQVRVLLHRIGV